MPTFQPFSSGGESSHLQTPESTPLRKRENDSFASPEAPLIWRHPLQPATGGLHNARTAASTYSPSMAASSSHFGEVNFAHMSRRRGRQDNHGAQFWVPWIMKGILASPVVVLTLWFIAVALHHPTEPTMKTHRYGATGSGTIQNPRNLQQLQQQQQNVMQAAHGAKPGNNKQRIPVYVPMGSTTGQQQQQPQFSPVLQANGMQGAPQLLMSQANTGQNGFMMMSGGQEQFQGGFSQEQPQMMMMSPPQQSMMSGQNMMQLTQQQPGQLYQQQQQLPQQMMMQGQPQMMQAQPQMMQGQPQMMMAQNQLQQGQLQMQQGQVMQPYENQQPALTSAHGKHAQNQRPVHPNKLSNFFRGKKATQKTQQQQPMGQQPQVYYYDPAQAVVHGNQLQPPSLVYDQHGNEVQLASLTSVGTEVHMEAPRAELMDAPHYGSTSSGNSQRSLVVSSNSTINSTGPILLPPPLEMNLKTPESWGESTSQDQSIIVCTVAVMALLVGALSARRLRARSFLSSCIENESLEHEVAFDNATTFTGAGDSYNTFGWKGDLEKFDV